MLADEVGVVRSLVGVSEAFLEIAWELQSLSGVQTVTSPCFMRAEERVGEDQFRVGRGEGFRIEWYAEAEFGDRAVSFSEELSWHAGEWVVDASVRANDAQGEHMLVEFPRRFAVTAQELVAEMRGQTQLLLERRGEALRCFAEYR
jgi:hypothetical protein